MVKVQLLEQDFLTNVLPAAVDHCQESVNYILLRHTTHCIAATSRIDSWQHGVGDT